jgi:hypothetical protein
MFGCIVTARIVSLVAVATFASLAAGGCSSSESSVPASTAPSFSITIPPNAIVNGTVGTMPATGDPSATTGPATSVAPENQAFCQVMQQAGSSFGGNAPDSESDSDEVAGIKATFQQLVAAAPSSIKPEVQGMNNTIQSVTSSDDIAKLDNPDFTNEQAAVAQWVHDNCGFDVG